MAQLAVQTIVEAGLAPTYAAAAAGGDTFANTDPKGRVFLHAKNGHSSSQDVIIASPGDCDQGFEHPRTVAVPAGGERMIGPFPAKRFNDPVSLTYSGVTLLTVAAIKLP